MRKGVKKATNYSRTLNNLFKLNECNLSLRLLNNYTNVLHRSKTAETLVSVITIVPFQAAMGAAAKVLIPT